MVRLSWAAGGAALLVAAWAAGAAAAETGGPQEATASTDPAAEHVPTGEAAAEEAPAVHIVVPVDLEMVLEREGRLEPALRRPLRYEPEAFGGRVEVARVLRDGGEVEAGEPVLELTSERLERELRAAREALDVARRRLEIRRRDAAVQVGDQAQQTERARQRARQAANALEAFQRFESDQILRRSELSIEQMKVRLENAREELAQLEAMYEDAELASETRDIVLERARRAVQFSEAYLELALEGREILREITHPDRERAVEEEARWAREALERQIRSERTRRQRNRLEIETAERAVRDAEERLEALEADRALLTLTAPASGLLTPIELEPGDAVEPRRTLAEVIDAGRYIVRIDVAPEELRVAKPDLRVHVHVPEIPEVVLPGEIRAVGFEGRPADGGVRFEAKVAIDGASPLWRPGMRCVVEGAGPAREGALAIPRSAVVVRGGRAYCYVQGDDGPVAVAVELGAVAGDLVEVRSGLDGGESVMRDAAGVTSPAAAAPAKHPAPDEPAAPEEEEAGAADPQAALLEDGWRASAEGAQARGVEFVVASQNASGSWGSFASSRPREIFIGTVASFRAFEMATTALCLLALLEPSREDAAARAALERGLAFALAAEPPARARGDTFYDTWAHTYLLQLLAEVHADERFAAERPAVAAALERQVATLARRQAADGGWGYYDFGYGLAPPSGLQSTSFLTAVVLLALRDAEREGFAVDERVVRAGLLRLEDLRLPSGAYAYGTGNRLSPAASFNRREGSLGRSQPCNLALWRVGGSLTRSDVVAGVEAMRAQHHFLEIGKGRPIPHESWYGTAGYYYFFGHYYAGLALEALEGDALEVSGAWLARTMTRRQASDGSWFDFPLYGYGKAYGTAFALLTLQAVDRAVS